MASRGHSLGFSHAISDEDVVGGTARRGPSLNHFIHPGQQGRGERQPERLGGLHIEDQLELRRLLYR